ncbi:MAG: glycoside hydrolase family 65, partial [Clostridia bacterium]|nr:glycoside hydrolase family 65 [Clostridia bacterium]
MVNRKEWTTRHDPVLTHADAKSPLTVGNGDFAFTADITGLQTLYNEYKDETPLCTQSNSGWHIIPADTPTGKYTLGDVRMDTYDFCGREVTYAKTKFPGNEHVYDWLRQNPHKVNLMRIGLKMNGEEIPVSAFSSIRQKLHLYEGLLESCWTLCDTPSRVRTACAPEKNVVAFEIESKLLKSGLTADIDFPYGACDITASDWNAPEKHTTRLDGSVIKREMDNLKYTVCINAENAVIEQVAPHTVRIKTDEDTLKLSVSFGKIEETAENVFKSAADWWKRFWDRGGAIDFSHAKDKRAIELERRIVLSLYLLAVNSSGSVPPAETGLICNSWYGKAHLEMHFWHMAWAPLWGHGALLERCLQWYHDHLPEARMNARRNGYAGARWPKMIADDG